MRFWILLKAKVIKHNGIQSVRCFFEAFSCYFFISASASSFFFSFSILSYFSFKFSTSFSIDSESVYALTKTLTADFVSLDFGLSSIIAFD